MLRQKEKMNNTTGNNELRGMVFYRLFASDNGRFAVSLANEMKINSDEFESLIKLGCYAFLGFAQSKVEFEHYMMTQYEFEKLRSTNPSLHELLKDSRKKAQSKWSNEQKNRFRPQIDEARCLPEPPKWDLSLARIEATVSCARFLNQVGQVERSKLILNLFAPEVIDR